MAKREIKVGSTSVRDFIFAQDTSKTDGSGVSGLDYTKFSCSYSRDDDGNAGATVVSLATMTRGTWTSGGLVEKDATHAKGDYEVGYPNAAFASGSKQVTFTFYDAGNNNIAPIKVQYALVQYDPQDSVRLGLTALANASAGGANGLLINGTNSGSVALASLTIASNTLTFDTNGLLKVDVEDYKGNAVNTTQNGIPSVDVNWWNGQAVPGPSVSGVPLIDLKYIRGTQSAGPAGYVWASDESGIDTIEPQLYATQASIELAVKLANGKAALSTSDWTPAAGEVLISKDGAQYARVTNLPTYITTDSNGDAATCLKITLTAAELTCGQFAVIWRSNASPEVIRYGGVRGKTYGNASAGIPPGTVDANVVSFISTVTGALTETTAGNVAHAVKQFFDVATPTSTMNNITTVTTTTTATNVTNAPTAGDFTSTMKTSLNASTPASIQGNVGGKVLGGGSGVITGTGVWGLDGAGNQLATAASVAALPTNASILSAVTTTALTESYATPNTPGSLAQLLYMLYSGLCQFIIAGTVRTSYKLDGQTTAMVWGFDNASTPLQQKRTA
jgi:hypothetical protein